MTDDDEGRGDNPLDLPEIADTRVAPGHGISAMALSLALRYHGFTTVQDGAMYQQLKLEGKKLKPLGLGDVLKTAERFELWIIGGPDRIAGIVMDAVKEIVDDGAKPEGEER